MFIIMILFENVEQRYEVDMVDIMIGFVMQCRSFPPTGGEREGERGQEPNDEWSVATNDAMKNQSWVHHTSTLRQAQSPV